MKQPLFGREDLLTSLLERYRKAQCGDGGAILFRGDAGVGKTRLIETFHERMRADDSNIVATATLDYAPSPFAPIVTIVEDLKRARPRLFEDNAGLSEVADLIVQADAGSDPPSMTGRRRLFDGIAQIFRIAAAEAPTTVIVDDLHYADPATIQLLYHITVATRNSAFLLIGATRSSGIISSEVRTFIARLEGLENVTSVQVEPLSDSASEALILAASKGAIDRERRARIKLRAEGNPLFIEELVRQALTGSDDAATRVPTTIFESIRERFSALPDEDQNALRLAAAFGRTFDAPSVARVAGLGLPMLLPMLRRAVNLRLVDETKDPLSFRFSHALMQEAVYAQLLKAEREDLHRRIFTDLERRPHGLESVAALAFHAFASGNRLTTAYYSELAGDYAGANQAVESGAEFYERALFAHGQNDADGARIAQKLAHAYLLAGFPERAVEPEQRALAYYRSQNDIESIADALLLLAEIAGQIGDDERRLELVAQAREALSGSSELRLAAKRSLCDFEIAIAEREVDEVIEACNELVTSNSIDVPTAVALRNAQANALLMQHRYKDAIATQARAVHLAARRGSVEQLGSSRFALGSILALSGDLERAGKSFERAANIAKKRWATTESAIGIAFEAETELMRGNMDRGRVLVEEGLTVAQRSDHPLLIVMIGRTGIFLGLRTDDLALVRRVVSALDLEVLFREGTPERMFQLSGAFAQYLALIEQRKKDADRVLERAVGRLSSKRLRSTDWSVCSMLTIAMIGNETDIPAARKPLTDWFAPQGPAFVHLFDAFVADRFGRTAEAAEHAERAVIGFQTFKFRFEEAAALSLAGRKREALQIFEQLGANSLVQKLREELTPRNRQGRAANALTSRELDVAALVARGLTNREIADRLSVTEKTVETHLASVFMKLEVHMRSEVAERLESQV
jgi:DNA-binding CsgD family transcriptional regulator